MNTRLVNVRAELDNKTFLDLFLQALRVCGISNVEEVLQEESQKFPRHGKESYLKELYTMIDNDNAKHPESHQSASDIQRMFGKDDYLYFFSTINNFSERYRIDESKWRELFVDQWLNEKDFFNLNCIKQYLDENHTIDSAILKTLLISVMHLKNLGNSESEHDRWLFGNLIWCMAISCSEKGVNENTSSNYSMVSIDNLVALLHILPCTEDPNLELPYENSLTPSELTALARVLAAEIKPISLAFHTENFDGLKKVFEALQNNRTLETLAIDHRRLSDEQLEILATFIENIYGLTTCEFLFDENEAETEEEKENFSSKSPVLLKIESLLERNKQLRSLYNEVKALESSSDESQKKQNDEKVNELYQKCWYLIFAGNSNQPGNNVLGKRKPESSKGLNNN